MPRTATPPPFATASATPSATAFDPQARLQALLARAAALPAVRCAVVHPCDEESLSGALQAAQRGLMVPVLRECDGKGLAQLEKDIGAYAVKARDGKITLWRDSFDYLDLLRANVRGVLGIVVPSLSVTSRSETPATLTPPTISTPRSPSPLRQPGSAGSRRAGGRPRAARGW